MANHYLNYTNDIDKENGKALFSKRRRRNTRYVTYQNTIPNVSSVVFKNIDMKKTEKQLEKFKIAGDWFSMFLFLQRRYLLQSIPLNYHRRHLNSVTRTEDSYSHYNEVVQMQNFIKERFTIDDISKMKMYTYRKHLKAYLKI